MTGWNGAAHTTCPHCHKQYTNNTLQRHLTVCIHEPSMFAATKTALDNGDGFGKTIAQYAKTHGATPSTNALYDLVGSTKWRDVVQFFGLQFSMARQKAEAQAETPAQPIVEVGYAAVIHAGERIYVCGLPVCRVIDYGNVLGFVLR